jgi:HlyD family secretion protein
VTVVEAAAGRVEETVTNSRAGTVRARRRARMSPEIGGRIVEIPHREGERVEPGEVVLRLEDDVYRARLGLAERDLDSAAAERERACVAALRAGRERQRIGQLAADGIASTAQLDQVASQAEAAAAACRAAEAGVERGRAAVELAATELSKTVLRAPFAGVVADLEVELGEWTTPSPPALPVPPVLDLIDLSSLYVSAPMDEVDSARIAPDQPVRVTVDSHRDRSFDGRVARVAPYVLDVQEQNRTVEVEVELAEPGTSAILLPGTSADVEIILEAREGALRVPASALLEGDRVLVLEDGLLAERRLEVGLRNWDFVEVVSGLAAGDRVVTSLDRPEVVAGARATVAQAPKP